MLLRTDESADLPFLIRRAERRPPPVPADQMLQRRRHRRPGRPITGRRRFRGKAIKGPPPITTRTGHRPAEVAVSAAEAAVVPLYAAMAASFI